ncbi:MAG: IPExxxVDY family protein [Bacteroidales bacterium]|nr:IPExxxVDY family protein [Bacteroidales bacterium]
MGKRSIVKLEVESVVFTIIGISSHENDYRLSWSINEHLGLSFVQNENLVAGDGREFTCFVHEDDHKTLLLISNRCDNGFLLEKFKNIDFILKFNAELNESETSEWLRNLKKAPLISTVFNIPANKKIFRLLR